MRDRLAILGVAFAAAPAGLFLAAPSRTGEIVGFTAEPPGFPWGSATTATAWGLLAALAVCVGARRIADALFVGGIAAITVLVVGISSSPPILLTAVAAGVLLGSAVQISRANGGRAATVAAVAGAMVGIFLAPILARMRAGVSDRPRRYADYIPSSGLLADTTVVEVGTAVLAAIGMVVLLACLVPRRRETITASSRRIVLGAGALVVGGALVHWWFLRFISASLRDETRTGLHTFYGGYVLLALAVVGALAFRRHGGLIVVAAAASTVAVATDGATATGAALAAVTATLVSLSSVVTATVLWRTPAHERARGVPIAVVVLILFTATQFITDGLWQGVPVLLGPFGVPVVVAMALTAAVVAGDPAPVTVVGALALLTLTRLTTGSDFGWTAYTPLTDGVGFDGITGDPESTAQTVVAVLALGVCLVVAVILTRRRGDDPSVV